mgnify:CR=1 FL=1|tara:strand:- start:2519 stop:4051 length:1533 start_codon:yes stop_codon:yes gene_type:complete
MEPINYLQQVADPFAQSLQGFKIGAGMADVEAKRAQAEQQQRMAQMALEEQARFFAKPNPTMRDALQFASSLPKDRADALRPYIENFSKEQQQNVLKANGQILSALQINPDTGIKMLQDYATAQRNSGDQEEAALYDRLAEAAADPARGPAMAFKSLVTVASRIPGAKDMFETIDKANTTARNEALAPSVAREAIAKADKAVADATTAQATATNAAERAAADAAKATADAQKAATDAKFAGPLAQGNLNLNAAQIKKINSDISNAAVKLNLDVQTMQATVAEKLSSIQKNLNEIPADTRKLINESATLAAVSKQSANQMNDLAKRIEDLGGYGAASRLGEFAKKTFGAEGYETSLRQEYTRLRNQAGIKSLPPGPATDKDIALALKGFPEDTSNAKSIASFLRGMAKLQEIDAASNNAKTDWLAQNNGALTRAGKTFIAGDYTVNPGETFNDFNSRVVSDVSKRYRSREQMAEDQRAATMAKIPTTGTPAAAPAPVNIRAQADAILSGGR